MQTLAYDGERTPMEVENGFDDMVTMEGNAVRPRGADGRPYYFEVEVREAGDFTLGVAARSYVPKPHGVVHSVAYRSTNGKLYEQSSRGRPYGPVFARKGDVVGCSIDAPALRVFFTHNGRALPPVALDPAVFRPASLHPILCARRRGVVLAYNMGGPPYLLRPPRSADSGTEALPTSLARALDSPAYFPDVAFLFRRQGTAVYAHKALLAARSLTFSIMFNASSSTGDGTTSDTTSGGSGAAGRWQRTELGGLEAYAVEHEPAVFRKLLGFIYGGHARLYTRTEARQLLELASHYSVESLIAGCAKAARHDYTRPGDDLLRALLTALPNTTTFTLRLYASLKARGARTVAELAKLNIRSLGLDANTENKLAFIARTMVPVASPDVPCYPYDVYEDYRRLADEVEGIADSSDFSDLAFVVL